ncbi:MAG: hypothetical protein HKL98_02790 [Burkholderiales bacterium]|nr:hypothetical protein [Burkholderiales bacterium]
MIASLILHLLGATVWVGGMFFAYMALRPVAAELLAPPERLSLWAGVFSRFFPWVWASIALLFSSGTYMIFSLGGLQSVPWSVHAMFGIGAFMLIIFCIVFFLLFARLRHAVVGKEWKQAGGALQSIRKLIALNLALGLLEIALGALSMI